MSRIFVFYASSTVLNLTFSHHSVISYQVRSRMLSCLARLLRTLSENARPESLFWDYSWLSVVPVLWKTCSLFSLKPIVFPCRTVPSKSFHYKKSRRTGPTSVALCTTIIQFWAWISLCIYNRDSFFRCLGRLFLFNRPCWGLIRGTIFHFWLFRGAIIALFSPLPVSFSEISIASSTLGHLLLLSSNGESSLLLNQDAPCVNCPS